jgi:Tfp pilus assembly protein PilF
MTLSGHIFNLTARAVLLPLALLVLLAATLPCVAQRQVRTEDGIIDLLDESKEEEYSHFKPNIDVFQLKGETRSRASGDAILTLGLRGPIVALEDNNPSREDVVRKYIQDKEWRKALAEVNDGLALNPDNPGLLRLAAFISTILNDFYMANYYYQRYFEINPKDLNVLTNWAGIKLRTFEFADADKLLDQALALDSRYVPARFYKTIIAIATDESRIDESEWRRLLLAHKKDMLGWISTDTENYRNILGPTGFDRLCDVVLGDGSAEEIEVIDSLLREYYALPPSDLDGRLAKLDELSQTALAGAAIDMERAVLFFRKGDADRALALAEDILQKHPSDAVILAHYGYMLLGRGEYSKAESVLRRSLADGNVYDAKLSLASALIMMNRADEAWELVWQMVGEDPNRVLRWLQGSEPYIIRLSQDDRYSALCNRLGIPPESR